jgi:KaiC/GvpD/RAD55 family RecA-like ATPase
MKKKAARRMIERILTGIPGLDNLIEGGFVKNSTIMVRGNTGTCKTIFCLQYLYDGIIEFKEPGVYLSFAESKETICQHGKMFGWDFENLEKKEMFNVIRYEPHEVVKIMDEGGGSIRDGIESLGAKRLVIDSLTAYAMLFENRYKANESVLTLFEMLRKWNTTTVVTSEFPVSPTTETDERLGFLTDAIINLYNVRTKTERSRILEIVKMRDTLHSTKLNRLMIDDNGLKVKEGGGKIGRK